jgi:DNA-binding CsgD family transcriptional regulator
MSRFGANMSLREKETLVLLAKKKDAGEISDLLHLTPNYVYSVIRMLKIRFDAKTVIGVVLNAIAEGVITIDGELNDESANGTNKF